jgi:N-acetylneuraminic acid mutarotase
MPTITARRRAPAVAPAAASGTWSAVGDLPFAGFWASQRDSAILLADGRVLIAGGEDGSRSALANAALFDPTANTWSSTGNLLTSRRLHTATRLADGRVLVAGGITGANAAPSTGIATAEIFDPSTGSWTATGSMTEPRFSHSATLLANGKILVAGGAAVRSADSNRALYTAELFDPSTGQWAATATMSDARFGHPALALSDGRVLVVGGAVTVGRGQYGAQSYCELFDPTAATWTATGSMASTRKSHEATLLADGTVLATGGDAPTMLQDWNYQPYSLYQAERFTPSTGAWAAAPDMDWGRSHHRAILLGSGKLLVVGGTDSSTFDIGYQNATVFDPTAGSWSGTIGTVLGRWAFAATRLADGRVLAAGGITLSGAAAPGTDQSTVTATTEVYTP